MTISAPAPATTRALLAIAIGSLLVYLSNSQAIRHTVKEATRLLDLYLF